MTPQTSSSPTLAVGIIDRVESLLVEAEQSGKPLELEPYRTQLFELFVMTDAAGYLDDESACDMSADGLCRALSGRWGLADATRESFANKTKLPPDQLARMRLLWSLMRMWMEWSYAWKRWAEFHAESESD
jgi:hypothetical protein